jgi:hypothetical protein
MAQGDILYRGAASWARLPAGTSGQVLQTNGAAADPTWETPGGGGGAGNVSTAVTLTAGQLVIGAGGTDIAVGNLSGDVTTSGGTATTLKTAARTRGIGITVDGGGSAITTGVKGDIYCTYACTITAVTMLADQSGSVVIDLWKDTYANYPPTVADSITASAKPTIATAVQSQDTTLTGWTTSVSAGDTIRFNVDSASTITRVTLVLTVTV